MRSRVGLDSDLDSLTDLNARSAPILAAHYLPDGFELIYGCGDRGTQEFVCNAAIADCDRTSVRLLNRLKNGPVPGSYFTARGKQYTRWRYWSPPAGIRHSSA